MIDNKNFVFKEKCLRIFLFIFNIIVVSILKNELYLLKEKMMYFIHSQLRWINFGYNVLYTNFNKS